MIKILVEKKDDGRQITIEMKDGDKFDMITECTAGVMKLCEGLAEGDEFEKHALMYSIGKTLVSESLAHKYK